MVEGQSTKMRRQGVVGHRDGLGRPPEHVADVAALALVEHEEVIGVPERLVHGPEHHPTPVQPVLPGNTLRVRQIRLVGVLLQTIAAQDKKRSAARSTQLRKYPTVGGRCVDGIPAVMAHHVVERRTRGEAPSKAFEGKV